MLIINLSIKLPSFQLRDAHYVIKRRRPWERLACIIGFPILVSPSYLYDRNIYRYKDGLYYIDTWFSCGVYIGFAHGYLHSIMLLVIDFMLFTSTLNKHTYVLDMIYVSGLVSYLRGQTQTGVPAPTWQGIEQRYTTFQFVCLLSCIGHCDNLHDKLH